MLINLFSDTEINGSLNRVTSQIETRSFQFAKNIDFREAKVSKDKIAQLVGYYYQMSGAKRVYDGIEGISTDNMFIFEACGLERGSTDNTIVLDFSESLDYILHVLSGCKIENVHKIKNYKATSRAIMNMEFDKLGSVLLGNFLEVDADLNQYLMGMLRKITSEETNEDRILQMLLYQFFCNILCMTARIRDYCALSLRKNSEHYLVFRSKSYAAAVLACDSIYDDDLVLRWKKYDDYVLHVQSFKRFEYLEKGGVYI